MRWRRFPLERRALWSGRSTTCTSTGRRQCCWGRFAQGWLVSVAGSVSKGGYASTRTGLDSLGSVETRRRRERMKVWSTGILLVYGLACEVAQAEPQRRRRAAQARLTHSRGGPMRFAAREMPCSSIRMKRCTRRFKVGSPELLEAYSHGARYVRCFSFFIARLIRFAWTDLSR